MSFGKDSSMLKFCDRREFERDRHALSCWDGRRRERKKGWRKILAIDRGRRYDNGEGMNLG
jgi:hypothetical protein